jgi:hypothetical protein
MSSSQPSTLSPLAGDWLTEAGLCRVCGLALPRKNADDGICSRRCSGRRRLSAEVQARAEELSTALLAELQKLAKDSTICPGELSQRVLPGPDLPLGVLRPLIFQLNDAGRLRLSQKGVTLPWTKIRGPFRVRRK